MKRLFPATLHISTHTLTWSVTVAGKEVEYLVGNFNSHAHVERDPFEFFDNEMYIPNFNSHAHVERDGLQRLTIIVCYDFNSHAHVERDNREFYLYNTNTISTHTLTWSVTQCSH